MQRRVWEPMLRLRLLLPWQLTIGDTQRRVRKAGVGMVGRHRQLLRMRTAHRPARKLRPTCRPTRRLLWQPL